jgi:hypothetical protein
VVPPAPGRLASVAGLAAGWAPWSSRPGRPCGKRRAAQSGPWAAPAAPRASATACPGGRVRRRTARPRFRAGTRRAAPVAQRVRVSRRSLTPRWRGLSRPPAGGIPCGRRRIPAGAAARALPCRGHRGVRWRDGLVPCPHPAADVVHGLQGGRCRSPGPSSDKGSGFSLGGTASRWTHQPSLDTPGYVYMPRMRYTRIPNISHFVL